MTLRRVGVLSCGATLGVIFAMIGFLAGALMSLLAIAGLFADQGGGIEGLLFGAGAIVLAPLFYGAMGFGSGVILALVYNLAALMTGGIEVSLDRRRPSAPDGGVSPFIMD